MDKALIVNSLSDEIMMLLREKLQRSDCIKSYEETMGNFTVITKEGIKYDCYTKQEKNRKEYVLYNEHFEKGSRFSLRTLNSKYFDSNIIPDVFEDFILKTEISYKAVKEGIKAFQKRTNNYDIINVLNNEKYLKYVKDNNLKELIYFLWNKGYEFATKFPDPDVVYNQYEYLRKQALERVDVGKIKELMLRHRDIHIYLDEDNIPEKAEELKNVKANVKPHEILLVVDSMTGQDAVNVAQTFNENLGIDGVILTKLDGDTRGGAALSVKKVTGRPIKFAANRRKIK